jgi:hypothetical protein
MGLVQEYMTYGESLRMLVLGIAPPYRSTVAKLVSLVLMLLYVSFTFLVVVVASAVSRVLPACVPAFMSILDVVSPRYGSVTGARGKHLVDHPRMQGSQ